MGRGPEMGNRAELNGRTGETGKRRRGDRGTRSRRVGEHRSTREESAAGGASGYLRSFRTARIRVGEIGDFSAWKIRGLEEANKLLHIQSSVPDQLSEKAWFQGARVWHRERFAGGIEWMPKANVATPLADNFVAERLKGPNGNLA